MTYDDFIKGARYKSETLSTRIEKDTYRKLTDKAHYEIEVKTIEYKGSIIKRTAYYINNKLVQGREVFLSKYSKDLETIIIAGNYLELEVPKEFLELIPTIGDAQYSLDEILDNKDYSKYLNNIDEDKLRRELEEYGTWDEQELEDHVENIKRFLWIKVLDYEENINIVPEDFIDIMVDKGYEENTVRVFTEEYYENCNSIEYNETNLEDYISDLELENN